MRLLGSRANADKVEHMLHVIERTNFATFSNDQSRHNEGHSLAPGWCYRGSGYLF